MNPQVSGKKSDTAFSAASGLGTYRGGALTILMLILAFNYVDRLALGLLLQDIKRDLGLSDGSLGFMTGIAFALFYSVMGIPLARWADRGNRVKIIAATTLLWSVAVTLCGFAANFIQLLIIRIGVAVGEAGCMPCGHSLIGDIFKRAERARAVAIFMLGGPLSMVIGYFAAGWLNEYIGWRGTFIVLGVPGVLLAVAALFFLREPRLAVQSDMDSNPSKDGEASSLKDVARTLAMGRSFRHIFLAFSISSFFAFGIAQWQAAFFIRSYDMGTGELGTWFAIIYGGGGLFGTYVGGVLASRYARNREGLQLKVIAAVLCLFGLAASAIYLTSHLVVALGLLFVTSIAGSIISGPLFAVIQSLTPARMRATAIAIIYLAANLIGMGLGPLAVGLASDALGSKFGEDSLRYALLFMSPGYLWVAFHLIKASQSVHADLAITADSKEALAANGRV